jgi:acetoin utilization protein AcuB
MDATPSASICLLRRIGVRRLPDFDPREVAMQVARLMTRKLITVRPIDSIEEAIRLLRQRGVRHLLVIEKTKLVGIISDRDLKRALEPSKTRKRVMAIGGLYFLLEPILVEEIMTPRPITITPTTRIQDAARLMLKHHFGALPVIEGAVPVGIITESDLLHYFTEQADRQEVTSSARKKAKRKAAPRSA